MWAEEGEGPPAELGGFSKDSRLPLRLRILPAGDADLGLSVATRVNGAPGISSARGGGGKRRLQEGYCNRRGAKQAKKESATAVAINYVSGALAVATSFVSQIGARLYADLRRAAGQTLSRRGASGGWTAFGSDTGCTLATCPTGDGDA
jgi:hypothetical protein